MIDTSQFSRDEAIRATAAQLAALCLGGNGKEPSGSTLIYLAERVEQFIRTGL